MPKRAPTPCKTPLCPTLVTGSVSEFRGYCVHCAKSAARTYARGKRDSYAVWRRSNTVFYKRSDWRRCRKAFISKNPLCKHCSVLGITSPAVDIDHVLALSAGGAQFDFANLQALCKSCHSIKTRRDAAASQQT